MALAEDGALLGPSRFDMGNSGLVQQGPQGAHATYIRPMISQGSEYPNFAVCQQMSKSLVCKSISLMIS